MTRQQVALECRRESLASRTPMYICAYEIVCRICEQAASDEAALQELNSISMKSITMAIKSVFDRYAMKLAV